MLLHCICLNARGKDNVSQAAWVMKSTRKKAFEEVVPRNRYSCRFAAFTLWGKHVLLEVWPMVSARQMESRLHCDTNESSSHIQNLCTKLHGQWNVYLSIENSLFRVQCFPSSSKSTSQFPAPLCHYYSYMVIYSETHSVVVGNAFMDAEYRPSLEHLVPSSLCIEK